MKLLLWLMLAVLVYFAVRKNFRNRLDKTQQNHHQQSKQEDWGDNTSTYSANQRVAEAMLSCARCNVYFPASEVVVRGTQNFCCQEHADLSAGVSS